MKVQPIYTSKIVKKGLEFAADNSLLFGATASFVLSAAVRSPIILLTPHTDKENKKYACAKSLASSFVNYLTVFAVSMPFAKALKKIDNEPQKFLKQDTIKMLQSGEKSLAKSRRYSFATQLFKLGLGFLLAAPKSALTCSLIPSIMSKISPKKDKKPQVSFTGAYDNGVSYLAKRVGKLIDSGFVKNMSEKFHNTNFEHHMMSVTDIFATGAFMFQTSKSKKIEENRKKPLMYNAAISTGFSIAGSYLLSKMLDKPTEKFVKKFSEINKNSPKLEKYLEGIKVVKPALILGGIYYIVIPVISTFLADRVDNKNQNYAKKA